MTTGKPVRCADCVHAIVPSEHENRYYDCLAGHTDGSEQSYLCLEECRYFLAKDITCNYEDC